MRVRRFVQLHWECNQGDQTRGGGGRRYENVAATEENFLTLVEEGKDAGETSFSTLWRSQGADEEQR